MCLHSMKLVKAMDGGHDSTVFCLVQSHKVALLGLNPFSFTFEACCSVLPFVLIGSGLCLCNPASR